jgi:hypothetical protein
MRRTFNTRITGPDGDVIVFTKVRYLFLFHLPRTSVMPFSGEQLGAHGVQFHWNTDKEDELERLHLLITAATKKLTLQELRLRLRPDAPAPEELKEISRWIKRVI